MSSQNVNPFLSGTTRGDFWKNELSAPYTKATFNRNPGPGAYLKSKKKEDIRARLLQEETVTVPFGASDERGCNKMTKVANPGPGTYIDINNPNNSSICKSLNKIQEDRTLAESQGVKLGAFGSTTLRADFWQEAKKGPGPGTYDDNFNLAEGTCSLAVLGKAPKARIQTTEAAERRKPNSVFNSTADRFNMTYSAKNPSVRLLTSNGYPRKKIVTQTADRKMVLEDQKGMGIENQITCMGFASNPDSEWHKQTRASDYEQVAGKKVGFDATSPRFHFN